MSDPPEEQRDFGEYYTVFEGSSPEDVSHARRLWSSLSLLPPLESRLVSADIRQRLPVSRSAGPGPGPGPRHSAPRPPSEPVLRQRREERQRFLSLADQRRETMALLRRQRERRIRKELLSAGFKAKLDREREAERPESEEDQELVKQLQ